MIKDYVTAEERLDFNRKNSASFYLWDCYGCGKTIEEVVDKSNPDPKVDYDVRRYCHVNCYRDSH